MFAKLLKYDMKSVSKVGVPAIIVTLIAGIVGFLISSVLSTLIFFMGDMIEWNLIVYINESPEFIQILSDILMALYSLTIVGTFFAFFVVFILISVIGTVILVITVVNFYKTLLTDEGYLTFTLPVSPTTILCSKLTNSVIWNILGGVVQLVSAFAMMIPIFVMSIAMEIRNPTPSTPALSPTAPEIISDIISWLGVFGSIITTLILALVMIVVTQLLYFFAVFLGGVVAKKHKLLAGAGFVILAHALFTTVQQGVQFFVTAIVFVLSILIGGVAVYLETILPIDGAYVITSAITTIISPVANILNILIFGVIAIILFILTNYLMNKKLNLP